MVHMSLRIKKSSMDIIEHFSMNILVKKIVSYPITYVGMKNYIWHDY